MENNYLVGTSFQAEAWNRPIASNLKTALVSKSSKESREADIHQPIDLQCVFDGSDLQDGKLGGDILARQKTGTDSLHQTLDKGLETDYLNEAKLLMEEIFASSRRPERNHIVDNWRHFARIRRPNEAHPLVIREHNISYLEQQIHLEPYYGSR